MQKNTFKVRLDEKNVKYRIVIKTDECFPNTDESEVLKFDLLSTIAHNKHVSACGSQGWDTLSIRHNGICWVAEAIATVEEPEPEN